MSTEKKTKSLIEVAYVSSAPHSTWELQVKAGPNAATKLLKDLAKSGWGVIAHFEDDKLYRVRFPGSEAGSWSRKDREIAMSACRTILASHGHEVVPYYKQ